MHPRIILSVLGAVVAAAGAAMLVPAAFSVMVGDGNILAFGFPAAAALILGASSFGLARNPNTYVSGRDVFFIVVSGWVSVAVVGTIPFVIAGPLGPVGAFFDSMAGFTTTGASSVSPENLAPSLLLWRSMMQWAGGIGIVVLFVAVALLVGFGSTQLYSAEAATPVLLAERLLRSVPYGPSSGRPLCNSAAG